MKNATISELKNRLSAYLRLVKGGETVVILDRNRPVARIERIDAESHPEGAVRRLEQAGVLRPATRPVPFELLGSEAPKAKKSVLAALLEDRAEGR